MLLKRTVASMVGAAILASSAAIPAYAEDFCFQECFDECVTNAASVDSVSLTGKNVHVVADDKNKEISFQSDAKESSLSYTVNQSSQELVLSADITVSGGYAFGGLTDVTSGTMFLRINSDGTIATLDNKKVGTYALGKKFNAAVVLHGKKSTYDIYLDGKKVIDDWYVPNSILGSIADVKYGFKAADYEKKITVNMDNVLAYHADAPVSSAPTVSYNPETTDFTEQKDESTIGDTIFASRTFDEEDMDQFSFISPQEKTNTISIEQDKGTGNKYISINKKTASDAFFEVTGLSGKYSHIVIDTDVRSNGSVSGAIGSKDNNSQFEYPVYLVNGNTFNTTDSQTITGLSTKKWTNIVLVLNYERLTYDVYVNKKLIYKDVKMSNQNVANPNIFRFHVWGGIGEFMFDNLNVYEGNEIKEDIADTPIKEGTIFYSDEDAQKLLGDKIALSLRSGRLYANNQLTKLENAPYVENGRTMIPVRAVSEGMGLDVNWNESEQKITIGTDTVMKIGDKKLTVKGAEKETDTAPQIKNDTAYLPMRALCEDVLGKKVFYDDRGIVVVSDSEYLPETADIWHIFNYLTYDHYTDKELIELFNTVNQNVHPRIMINQKDLDRVRGYYNTNSTIREWSDVMIQQADNLLVKEPEKYILNEKENALLDVSRSVLERMQRWGFAYLITGDTKYAERAWTELYAAGNFKDWCPTHYLDVAEMCAAFSVGYDWFYDYWTEEQKAFIADAIHQKCLVNVKNVYLGRTSGWWANVEENNWNAVCNDGAIMGAIAIFDRYPDDCATVINNGMRGLETLEQGFYPSGAWPEGIGYYAYALWYMMMGYSTINATFNTDFGLYKAPGVDKSAEFVIADNGTVGCNNYGDGPDTLTIPAELMWLGAAYNNEAIKNVRINAINNYGWTASLSDVLFYSEGAEKDSAGMALDAYFPNTELVSMRESFGSKDAAYISFHGGETFPNHGHSDGGAFVLDMLGQRFACDLGADNYALTHYWERLRPYYRQRAEGHNTLVINPDSSAGQDDGFAPVVRRESKARGAINVLDLSETYKSNVDKFERGYMLGDDRRSATIRDEVSFKEGSGNDVYWFMHTQAEIQLVDETTAILTSKGKSVKLDFVTDAKDAKMSIMEAQPLPTSPKSDPIELNRDAYKKLAIHFTAGSSAYIQVRIIPLSDPNAEDEINDLPISEWTIPDGERQLLPVVNNIYADGAPISTFSKTVTNYTVNVASKEVKNITADVSDDVICEITQAVDISSAATIKVTSKSNPKLYRVYNISYYLLPEAQGINGMSRIQPVDIKVSDMPQAENPDVGAIDNDLSTRWSAEGNGQWLVLTYDKPEPMEKVGIAVKSGDERSQKFDIQISDDNSNWTTVFSGATSGRTNEIEMFDIGNVTAKYIKLIGYGNTANMWNSITEFGAYHTN